MPNDFIPVVGTSNQSHAEAISAWFGDTRLLGVGVCANTGRLVLEFESGFLTLGGRFELDIRPPDAGKRIGDAESGGVYPAMPV